MALDLYCKGARVWVRDPESVWISATVLQNFTKDAIHVQLDSGKDQHIAVKDNSQLPPLRNPNILLGENDLTNLSYLHEPAVLHNLRVRFCDRTAIYTYCGIVLVAINPYQDLPIFGPETVWAYRGKALGDLEPHIFAIAEEAFTKMERVSRDQSIIVSGESGAGKTVSAKFAMRYFASVGGSASQETQIERKVLASNPVMEAIGNAKTIRNDNSSRFGKFIEIHFSREYQIQAANMRTYLLEKSRVVFQAPDERNYHIFYQLCAVREQDEFSELALDHQDTFHYLNQGECAVIADVDDTARFEQTRQALATVGIDQSVQTALFRVFAAVLHLGNVQLTESTSGGEDSCQVARADRSLSVVSRLLAIDHEQIRHWLCRRRIVSTRETFTKPMSCSQAVSSRDALAKHIYSQAFNWIVQQINKCLTSRESLFRFIGILDIYGFETFETNSFEQFCINYANEKLQQQFNQHVFKLDQEEYVREQIEWTFIDFYDNQPCIDLIESRLGVLDLLDEECRMPRGSDQSWVEKLYDKCNASPHFEKPRLSNSAFMVAHFADKVEYESASFLEKNRDTVLQEHTDVLKASLNPLVAGLFAETAAPVPKPRTGKTSAPAGKTASANKKTVGSQFRESLSRLMTTLSSTTPHYVRCIKPNDCKASFTFDPTRTVQQLRACGVLETIRISAAGFPSRWLYGDFFFRYRVLCRSQDIVRDDMQGTCQNILARLIKDEDRYKFGATKVFFRAGQVAYMEKVRADRLRSCAVLIQRWVRGWMQRRRYYTLRAANGTIQRWVRGFLARRRVWQVRRLRAAVRIQAYVRGWLARSRYQQLRSRLLRLQARVRGMQARQLYQQLRRNRAAVVLQQHVRGWLARCQYARIQRAILLLQCCVRRLIARRVFKAKKTQARSLDHQRKLNKGLENKIISMQQRITEISNESGGLKRRLADLQQLTAEVGDLRTEVADLRPQAARVTQLQQHIQQLLEQLDQERCDKMDLMKEKHDAEQLRQSQVETLTSDNIQLTEQLQALSEQRESEQAHTEELVRSRVEGEKTRLAAEYQQDRVGYQKLVRDKSRIEQHCEALQKELRRLKAHRRVPSGVSDSLTEPGSDTDRLTPDIHDEFSDVGYSSVRSHRQQSTGGDEDSLDVWQGDKSDQHLQAPHPPIIIDAGGDVSLMLKMQMKLKDAESDRDAFSSRLERLEDRSPEDERQHVYDQIRLQDLEMENAKVKSDLLKLRESVASDNADLAAETVMTQLQTMQDELERRREECIQLRTMITNNATTPLTASGHCDVSEQQEISMAFETQKQINRQIADELHRAKTERVGFLESEAEYQSQLQLLRQDNQQLQLLVSQTQQLPEDGEAGQVTEAVMQHEVTRITTENLHLRERIDALQDKLSKLKKQLKLYAKRYKEATCQQKPRTPDGREVESVTAGGGGSSSLGPGSLGHGPVVRHKSVEYLGMFEYPTKSEDALIRALIIDLQPKTVLSLLPGLPAFIMFMCIRHMDFCDDADKVHSFMTKSVSAVKRTITRRKDDQDVQVLWLVNLCRLLHCLKQYSGDEQFQAKNTSKQNEQSLRNFDLSEFRDMLNELAMRAYQRTAKLLSESVSRLVVPAILEHEEIPNLTASRPSRVGALGALGVTMRQLTRSQESRQALSNLLARLKAIRCMLRERGVEPEITAQLLRQVYHHMCAGALNNLLLRNELCSWSRGVQIRFNLSQLEQWARENCPQCPDVSVEEALRPVVQASQLLQSRKTDTDVDKICNSCDKLTAAQISKILTVYTPDDCEERIPISFIRQVQEHLMASRPAESFDTLLMESESLLAVRFPFTPSSIQLEDIVIPDDISLPMLKRT